MLVSKKARAKKSKQVQKCVSYQERKQTFLFSIIKHAIAQQQIKYSTFHFFDLIQEDGTFSLYSYNFHPRSLH